MNKNFNNKELHFSPISTSGPTVTGESCFGCKTFEIGPKKSKKEGFLIQIFLVFLMKIYTFFCLNLQLSQKSKIVTSVTIKFIIIEYFLIPKIVVSSCDYFRFFFYKRAKKRVY